MSFFKTTSDLKKYINIDVNMKFDKLKPFIDDAALRFMRPLLGESFFSVAATYYANATPDTQNEDMEKLMPYIQRAHAFYAGYLGIDEISVQVGDLGVQQQFNQNSQPAPASKVAKLSLKYITSADIAADLLLDYLEKNADPEKYGDWYTDITANTKMEGVIVYKTAIASKYIDINNSRRVFLRLKKRIRDIEFSYIRSLIGNDQYDDLVVQIQTGSLTDPNKKLIGYLEPLISKLALHITLPFLPISVEAEGIFMYSANDTVTQKQIVGDAEKERMHHALRDGMSGYKADEAQLDDFLKTNIADYPKIAASTVWANRPKDGEYLHRPVNDKNRKFFTT